MQSDDIIWDVINKNFCSYKTTFNKTKFCRNEYNVTGVCNKVSCPLANSRYATVREEEGVCYLYMKTVERAHTPAKMWEKIKLDANFMNAIEQIDSHLEFWPGHVVHRAKQRYIRITQYLIRMRKMRKQIKRELVPIKKKGERRDKTRESKALVAAQLTTNIKKELLDRLKKGTYASENYFPDKVFEDVIQDIGENDQNLEDEDIEDESEEENQDVEYVSGDEDEEEYEDEEEGEFEYELEDENYDDDDEDDAEFDEDFEEQAPKPKKKGARINIEFEEEAESQTN
ncbi:hypothetical protein CYY_008751 [Polysphondylium violaceum]|uniref:Protein MAK16 homolog n=1 Tax=Polysphondylium violaceum TaxID=133409 RepID=A0A8J4V107_9MYCE|nr:hypothetical protein CYY_008751 [Polysphondylium violaceum]